MSDVITEIDNQVDAQAEQLATLRRAVADAGERLARLEATLAGAATETAPAKKATSKKDAKDGSDRSSKKSAEKDSKKSDKKDSKKSDKKDSKKSDAKKSEKKDGKKGKKK